MAPSGDSQNEESKSEAKSKDRATVRFRLPSGITVGYPKDKIPRGIDRNRDVRRIPSLLSLRVESSDLWRRRGRDRLRHHRTNTRPFRRERDSSRHNRESSIDRDRRQRENRNNSPSQGGSRRVTCFARGAYRRHMGTSSSASNRNRNQAILAERSRSRMIRRDNEKLRRRTRAGGSDGRNESLKRHENVKTSSTPRMNDMSYVPKRRFSTAENRYERKAFSEGDQTDKRKSTREMTFYEERRQAGYTTSAPAPLRHNFRRRHVTSSRNDIRSDLRKESLSNQFSTRQSVIVRTGAQNTSSASESVKRFETKMKIESVVNEEQESIERDPRLRKRSYESYFTNPEVMSKVNSSETFPATKEDAQRQTILSNAKTTEHENVQTSEMPNEFESRDVDMGSIAAIYMSLDPHQQRSLQRELSRVYLENSLEARKTYRRNTKSTLKIKSRATDNSGNPLRGSLSHDEDSILTEEEASTESECESFMAKERDRNSFNELSIENLAAIVASDNKLTSTFFSKLESLQAASMKSCKTEQGTIVSYNQELGKPATVTTLEGVQLPSSGRKRISSTAPFASAQSSNTLSGKQGQGPVPNFSPEQVWVRTPNPVPDFLQNLPSMRAVTAGLTSSSSEKRGQFPTFPEYMSSIRKDFNGTYFDEDVCEAETEDDDEYDEDGEYWDELEDEDELYSDKYDVNFTELDSKDSAGSFCKMDATSTDKNLVHEPNAIANLDAKMKNAKVNSTLEEADVTLVPQYCPSTPKAMDITSPIIADGVQKHRSNRRSYEPLQTSDHSVASLLKPSFKRRLDYTEEMKRALVKGQDDRPANNWKAERLMEPKEPHKYLPSTFDYDYSQMDLSTILDPRIRKREAIRREQLQQEQDAGKKDTGIKKLILIEKEKYGFQRIPYKKSNLGNASNEASGTILRRRNVKLAPLPTPQEMERLVRATLVPTPETSPLKPLSPMSTKEQISSLDLSAKKLQTVSTTPGHNAQRMDDQKPISGRTPVITRTPMYPKVKIPEIDLASKIPPMSSLTPEELKEKHGVLVKLMGLDWIKNLDKVDDVELRKKEDLILSRKPEYQSVPHEGLRMCRRHEDRINLRRTLYFQCVELLGGHMAVYRMMSEEQEIRNKRGTNGPIDNIEVFSNILDKIRDNPGPFKMNLGPMWY